MYSEKSQLELFDQQETTSTSVAHSQRNTESDKLGRKRIDLPYLAGYLDGEGCFTHAGRGRTPIIKINSCAFDILSILADNFGGTMYRHGEGTATRRASWTWMITGGDALDLAADLIPYLIEKSSQAVALLAANAVDSDKRQYVMDFLKEEKKPYFEHMER